jgi:type III secretion system YscQ/HrcQ family protein
MRFEEHLATWLSSLLGVAVEVGLVEVIWRASGTRRTGAVAVLSWPRMSSQAGIGIETTTAHALVDRLLGFDPLPAETRTAVSPVEWGILTFIFAEGLHRLAKTGRGSLGPWDLTIDRVGPNAFEPADSGNLLTLRWPIKIGAIEGALRIWVPEFLAQRWLLAPNDSGTHTHRDSLPAELTCEWRAEAGTIRLTRGLRILRVGGVLPLVDSQLRGSPQSPSGPVELTVRVTGTGGRYVFLAEPLPLSGGGRLTLTGPLRHEPTPREGIAVNPSQPPPSAPSDAAPAPALDVPVTLVVELGRLNLPLSRLADLKPGEVLSLARHSKEPVELTSGGRLVARGELVQIDTELGVRVTQVFL